MSSNWVPPGSSGQGPPAGENTEPSLLRGVTPGEDAPEGGFRSNLQNMRESISVVGKLSAAMSSFYTKIGGEGKRKVTEFHSLIKTLNTDLEQTAKRLKEVGDVSGQVGGGGPSSGGGLLVPGPGGSYTQAQLPSAPGVRETVGREDDIAAQEGGRGGGWRGAARSVAPYAGAVAGAGLLGLGSWFNRQMAPVEAINLQQARLRAAGFGMPQSQRMMEGMVSPGGGFASREEIVGASQTLEQRGLALGGASYQEAMTSAGRMTNIMPQYAPEQFAGAAAELRHGQAGRNLRMKGIINWDMPTEEVFRQILKAGTRNKEMPSAEMLKNANPGSPYYEVIMVLTGGDPELTRMVLDYGRAEVAAKMNTGERVTADTRGARATRMDETNAYQRRQREAAAALTNLERQEELVDATSELHGTMRNISNRLREWDDGLETLIAETGSLAGGFSQAMSATGGVGGTLQNLGMMWMAGRMGAGKGIPGAGTAKKAWGWLRRGGGGAARAAASRGLAAGALGSFGLGAAMTGTVSAAKWLRDKSFDWADISEEGQNILKNAPLMPTLGLGEEPRGGLIHGADHTGSGYSTKGFGGVKPHVAQAGHYVQQKFGSPPGGIGGVGQRANKSDHPKGLALDFMTNKNYAMGDAIANFFVKNAKHFGVKYVIWKKRVNSIDGRGWRSMEDRGSPTANHMDHPHVSFHESPGTGTGAVTDADFAEEMQGQAAGFTGSMTSAASRSTAGSVSVEEADFLQGIFGSSGSPARRGEGRSGASRLFDMDTAGGGGGRPSVSSGQKLSDQELMNVLRHAGFSGEGLVTAFAIAKAESGGDAGAHNPNAATGDNSYGLFQINMLGTMGPARRKQYGLKSNEDLFDPIKNAQIAYQMSGGGKSWGHWSVHPSSKGRGAKGSGYEQHLDTARSLAGGTEPRGGLEMTGSLGAVGEGSPSGVAASLGGISGTRPGSAVRQVNFHVQVSFEKATRKEARELFRMMQDMATEETGIELVGQR